MVRGESNNRQPKGIPTYREVRSKERNNVNKSKITLTNGGFGPPIGGYGVDCLAKTRFTCWITTVKDMRHVTASTRS